MPAKPQTRSAKDSAIASEPLALSLAGFAAVQSEPELLALLSRVAAAHFGASHALILTREPALASTHRVSRLSGSAASRAIPVVHQAIEQRLREGSPFAATAPAAELPGLPVPRGATRAVLLPSSGEGSLNGVCLFWTGDDLLPGGAATEQLRLLAAMAGLAFDRQLSDLRNRIARADTDNRVRNVLAVIRSVGTRSAERASSMEEFLLHFEGRIDAIGRSQVGAARDGEIGFEILLREELLAQALQDDETVSLEGMDVSVTFEQAEALGLALHELSVNAVKFGAFAGPGGGLTVRWWVESGADDLVLNIDWRERFGPQARKEPPDRAGFGLTYLQQALPFQLNAEVTMSFAPSGLRCQMTLPVKGQGPRGRVPVVAGEAPALPGGRMTRSRGVRAYVSQACKED